MPTPSGVTALLAAILPTPEETLLLRACLGSGEAARAAWDTWCERVGDPRTALSGKRSRLLPLVLAAVRRNDLAAAPPLRTLLRAAYLHERLRSRVYRRVCGAVISALSEHTVAAVVLRGATLAETVYPEPALRHCHDIDLLVRPDELPRAAQLLVRHGFTPRRSRGADVHEVTLTHATGLPLSLHGALFQLAYYGVPFDDVWVRARTEMVAGVAARIPSAADHLVHVCGHASYSPSRASLQWVCDAWGLVERGDVDWRLLLDVAVAHLAMPLVLMLDYLGDALGAAIPAPVREGLRTAAARTDAEGIEAALQGVVRGSRNRLGRAFALAPDWRTRTTLARLLVVRVASRLVGS